MNSVRINDTKKYLASIDWFLVITVLITTAYGILLVISASNSQSQSEQTRYIIVQTAAAVLGIASMFILAKMDYDHITKYSKYLYFFGALLLALTLIVGTGDEAGVGQRNWIRVPVPGLGTVGIQPSELVKISFIITLATFLDKHRENINKFKNVMLAVLHLAVIVGLILVSGDVGNVLIFACIFLGMNFVAGVSIWYFIAGLFTLAATSPIWWKLMGEYQQMRIIVGFDPKKYPDSRWAYQALRSMQAIGSGGLTGQGYMNGYMTQTGRVSFQWTDFIFSAAGEEFGFIGALLVLVLLTAIIARVFYVSRNARNNVGSLICIGVMAMFIAQTVENIGMCIGKLPVIGVTLPFFSYGGSSVLSSLLGIGLVLSVNARKHIYYFTRDENTEIDDF